jgi:GH43 family beta-xylosidase
VCYVPGIETLNHVLIIINFIVMTRQFKQTIHILVWVVIVISLAGCAGEDTAPANVVQSKISNDFDLMSGNPILPLFTADPDIIYANGKYYIYPTATGPNASQFHAYSSVDFLEWTDEGIVLNLANVSWAHVDGWAPSVIARNGNYYFYYTAAKKIGVAVSTSPTGPFIDKGSALAVGDGPDPIDPMVFLDTQGQAYLYWGNTTLNIQRLNNDMISFTGELGHNKPSDYFEAPYVINRNNTYYLMYSVNDFSSDDYHVEYAVSSNPMGPWTTKGRITSPIGDIKGPGHNAVIRKPGCTDEYFFVYHRRTSTNIHERQVAIDRMFFDDAGNIMPINITTSGVIQSPGTAPCYVPNPIANGQYSIRSKLNTPSGAGLYLDISGCSTGNADVRTFTHTTCNGQKWNLTYQGNGYYKIISEQPTHKSLDLDACLIDRGGNIQVWDAFQNDCQQFRIEAVDGSWYRIITKAGNNVLDILDGNTQPDADVRAWSWNGNDAQLWKFEAP